MSPTIPSACQVRLADSGRPRFAQVWAYYDDEVRLVVHRYRRRCADGLLFRGDASRYDDPPVDPQRLVGRVIAVRQDGRARRWPRRERWLYHPRRYARALARRARLPRAGTRSP